MEVETMKVDGSKCINVKVTPSTEGAPNVEIETDDFLNQFSDKPLTEDPNAEKKLNSIIGYLKSSRFKKKVNSEAYKTGVPPKQVAQGVISKAFGIVGDILGIAVDTVSCTLNGLVDLLSNILHRGIDLVTKVVNGICRIVTFNQTACAS
jgi:hypothetical protein